MSRIPEVVPEDDRVLLRHAEGGQVDLSIEDAVILGLRLGAAVRKLRHPELPAPPSIPDSMDDAWAYVSMGDDVTTSLILFLGRREEGYYSRIMDCMGLSPMVYSRTRPKLDGLRPYVLFKEFAPAMPYIRGYREVYKDRYMRVCGLVDPFGREEFLDATESDDGTVLTVSQHYGARGIVQRVNAFNPYNTRNSTHYYSEGDPGYPYTIRSDVRHLTEEEARTVVADAIIAYYDSLADQVRPWFRSTKDEAEEGVRRCSNRR